MRTFVAAFAGHRKSRTAAFSGKTRGKTFGVRMTVSPGARSAHPMNAAQLSTIFAGISAVSFGAGDYCGGIAARRDAVLRIVVIGHAISGIVFLALAIATMQLLPNPAQFAAAAVAGTASGCGLLALYRGLKVGVTSVVAPLTTIFSAAVPVVVAIVFRHAIPAPAIRLGLLLLIAAVFLLNARVAPEPNESGGEGRLPRGSGAHLGVAAGIGFGVSLAFFAYADTVHPIGTLAVARIASTCLLGVFALRARTGFAVAAPVPVMLAAAADALGNVAYIFAVSGGALLVAAAVTNMYPAITVALDAAARRRMPAPAHLAGLAVATAAAIIIGQSGG